jgi:hypothetical protein
MKKVLRTSALVAALAAALPMLAQRGVSPSITNGTHLGYPAASILTPNNQRLGDSAPRIHNTGPVGTGAFAGHPVMHHGNKGFIPQHDGRHHGGFRFNNGYSIPYYPAYYYDPYSYGYGGVVVEDNSSLPGAGTFNTNQQQYPPNYRPSAGNDSVIDEQGGRFYERTITERSSEPLPDPSAKTQSPPAAPPVSAKASEDNGPNDVRTLLIFKDGRRLEIANYAIMGTTVYVFAGDRRKIPLTDLDVDATVKANEDRGTDFHVPPSPDPS